MNERWLTLSLVRDLLWVRSEIRNLLNSGLWRLKNDHPCLEVSCYVGGGTPLRAQVMDSQQWLWGLPPRASREGLFLLLPSLSGCSPDTLGAESWGPQGAPFAALQTLCPILLRVSGWVSRLSQGLLRLRNSDRSRRASSPLITHGAITARPV